MEITTRGKIKAGREAPVPPHSSDGAVVLGSSSQWWGGRPRGPGLVVGVL